MEAQMESPWHNFLEAHHRLAERFFDIKLWLATCFLTPLMRYFGQFAHRYLHLDWDFIVWLLMLMLLDLITGVLRAKKEGNLIRSVGLRRTVMKLIQYGVYIIVIHVLIHFRIDGKEVGLFQWIDTGALTFLMVIEAKSILENLYAIDNRVDLRWLFDKIKKSPFK